MNSFGSLFRVEIAGESHGPGVLVTVDGCPPGIPLSAADFEAELSRRRSGRPGTTPRKEADIPEILSGVFRGFSSGTPISILFRNGDTRSSDYDAFVRVPRPGHADFTGKLKYGGFNDPRGSGHFSGRITVGLVAAGAIAKKVLSPAAFLTRLLEAGGRSDIEAAAAAAEKAGDSIGGIVEVRVSAVPAGLGEPFFDSLESLIAHAVFSVPGVRGVEFGEGFASAKRKGSEHNDPFVSLDGRTRTNNSGGMNGGISNGNEIILRVAVKPASSISLPQKTLDFSTGKETELRAEGRHDACIALRAQVVIESACAIALADALLASRRYGETAPDAR